MTRRYFYSDPLAAAWMAKHFGMKLGQWLDEDGFAAISEVRKVEDVSAQVKAYIHPDSLPLLEPRIGDLIYITESKMGTLARRHDGNLKLFTGDWLIKPDHVSIIRRDDKPFFWPESEEE